MSTVGQTFECAGPDVLTLGELVRLAGRHGSTERPVLPLPMAIGRLQAFMMELAPGEPLMSRDNLAAMSVDNVATGQWPGLQRWASCRRGWKRGTHLPGRPRWAQRPAASPPGRRAALTARHRSDEKKPPVFGTGWPNETVSDEET
jgi:hypothetical protein